MKVNPSMKLWSTQCEMEQGWNFHRMKVLVNAGKAEEEKKLEGELMAQDRRKGITK